MSDCNSKNPLRLEDRLCFALYSTSRLITKKYATILADMDITYPQYLSLLVLWEQDGITIKTLAQYLELEPATTTPLVQRLVKLGLVKRERSKQDERRVHIYLTDKGKDYREKALKVPHALRCALNTDEDQINALLTQIKAFKNNANSAS